MEGIGRVHETKIGISSMGGGGFRAWENPFKTGMEISEIRDRKPTTREWQLKRRKRLGKVSLEWELGARKVWEG